MAAVSIKDIARIAGVSHSTVSRALRNSPLIPAHTRERIQLIAHQQGYAASAIARSLVTRRTHAIGVVVTSIADPFNGEVVSGIEETANKAGYSVVLATSQADPGREIALVRSFKERRVDGVLVASSRVGALYAESLADLRIPIVLLNNQYPGEFVFSISIDNADGAEQATRHLADLGHTKIAYIGDRLGMQSDTERHSGYTAALRACGIHFRSEYTVQGDGKPEGAREAAARLLALDDPPSAIFCYNDMSALGVLDEAAKRGLIVPRDLSVCGFDDLFFTPFLSPPLTTIRQPKREMGRRAMELLLSILSGEEQRKNIKIKGELIVRESTGSAL
ncbi:MAG: LacI family transcriptional regulator [Acidobacteriota bacterium]|nr:LacI family transcriptional regulator [Acidobacteriota bacterium]